VSELEALTERLDALEREQSALRDALERSESEREEYQKLYRLLREENARLKRGLLGQKAERLPADERQLSLSVLQMLLEKGDGTAIEAVETEVIREHVRRKPTGRKLLPDDLPRVEIELIPPEVEREGLDAYERIGEETSEVLERRPRSLVVVRIRRPKFVRKDRTPEGPTEVLIAPPAELPIERGRAGPGLLADTIVRRWQDQLPLHRMEGIFARDGVELARSTICGWHEQLEPLARPVVEAMWKDAFAQPYLCTDATGVLVQAREKCRAGHFWVVVAAPLHVLFAYTSRHDKKAVDRVLAGYRGFLVADAHAVYDHLYASGDVVEVGCWAHLRRYFFEAMASDPDRAREGLALISALFRIERTIADTPRKKREAVRRAKSRPIVDRFFGWCDALVERVIDDTPIAQALRYGRNQREALRRFLDDGRLPLDNNISERQLRREVVGRKNWLFVGSDDAAQVNVTFVSLLASCGLHALEPWAYLRDLLCLLPGWPRSRALELAPAYWKKTCQQTDTQQRLDANPFRSALLSLDHPALS
jgi:transposase